MCTSLIQRDEPLQYSGPAFPFIAALKAAVAAHELREDRMKLIFSFELELERIHQSDEVLRLGGSSATIIGSRLDAPT